MKKIILALLLILSFASCKSDLEQEIISSLNKEMPQENFHFIYGLDKEHSFATNVKYRGILYTDRLKKLNYPQGLEISLANSNVDDERIRIIKNHYNAMFKTIDFEELGDKKTKELFGDKSNFSINWTMTNLKYIGLKRILGKRNLLREQKYGSQSTIVDVFVDDLEKLNVEEYRKKTFELIQYLYDYMNYVTYLQIYIRDNSYLDNYDLVKYSIYKPFIKRQEIKDILKKVKGNKSLNESERVILINNFMKGGLDFEICQYRKVLISSKELKGNEKLNIKDVFVSIIANKED